MGLQVPIMFCWRTILGQAVCDYHALKMGTHSRSAEFCLSSNMYSVLTWKARVTFPRVHSDTFVQMKSLGSNIGSIIQLSMRHGLISRTHPLCGHYGLLPKQWKILTKMQLCMSKYLLWEPQNLGKDLESQTTILATERFQAQWFQDQHYQVQRTSSTNQEQRQTTSSTTKYINKIKWVRSILDFCWN